MRKAISVAVLFVLALAGTAVSQDRCDNLAAYPVISKAVELARHNHPELVCRDLEVYKSFEDFRQQPQYASMDSDLSEGHRSAFVFNLEGTSKLIFLGHEHDPFAEGFARGETWRACVLEAVVNHELVHRGGEWRESVALAAEKTIIEQEVRSGCISAKVYSLAQLNAQIDGAKRTEARRPARLVAYITELLRPVQTGCDVPFLKAAASLIQRNCSQFVVVTDLGEYFAQAGVSPQLQPVIARTGIWRDNSRVYLWRLGHQFQNGEIEAINGNPDVVGYWGGQLLFWSLRKEGVSVPTALERQIQLYEQLNRRNPKMISDGLLEQFKRQVATTTVASAGK